MSKTKVFISYVHPVMVTHTFVQCMYAQLGNQDYEYLVYPNASGPLISRARNQCLQRFLEDTDAEWYMSIDTDIYWQPTDIGKLIAWDKDIVGGLYMGVKENAIRFPVALVRDSKGLYTKANWQNLGVKDKRKRHGLVKVATVGMGFTLIRRAVIEKLEVGVLWPFAETMTSEGQAAGEDTTFCSRAEDKGFEIWLDLDTRVMHEKPQLI